jgi:hypothetical protein
MHHKLTKHGRFCNQNNQLPTKTHVELKDDSIANMKCRFGIYIPPFRFWGRVKHFLHINSDFACRGCMVKEDFTSRTRPYGLVEATVVS